MKNSTPWVITVVLCICLSVFQPYSSVAGGADSEKGEHPLTPSKASHVSMAGVTYHLTSTLYEAGLPAAGFVYVAGAVKKPGTYPLKDGFRLIDLLNAAGGTTPNADLAKAFVARWQTGNYLHIPAHLDLLLMKDKTEYNIPLLPGDTVVIIMRKSQNVISCPPLGTPLLYWLPRL